MTTTSNHIPPSGSVHRVLVGLAERALRHFGDDLSREDAAKLLPMWAHYPTLTETMRADVLAAFTPAAPVRWRDEDGDLWREVHGGLLRREIGEGHLGVRTFARHQVEAAHGPLTLVGA